MSSLQRNWRKGQNRFCLEVEGGGAGGVGGNRGREENGLNNVCTYE